MHDVVQDHCLSIEPLPPEIRKSNKGRATISLNNRGTPPFAFALAPLT